ncbi:M48 family metalloprotease [Adhaeribacter swui]|uniref:M48 family metalloprotease n=1 Tax=Adhaeribacter swui TaxID=2086471 RepID=A0A7G7G769_9BACT|nr:M56 family metallopeptidase [Adhaeribacter swui]QNF33003.1 M48 family metalloprotease [Adhaeribacter swui]
MNYLPAFLSPRLVEALGWTILHSLWQGALVAVVLSVLLILLQRHSARLRYAVATSALLATLLIAGITFIRTYQQASVSATLASRVNPITTTPEVAASNKTKADLSAATSTKPVLRGAILVNFKYYFSKHLPAVVLVWLLGMLTMLLKFLGGLAYVQRLKYTKIYPLGQAWHNRLTSIAHNLGVTQTIQLFESTLVKTPLVIGYFKPVILLPFGTIAGLSPDQVEAILAHELAHIYRKDYLLNMLQTVVEILFFYNPATWWISDYVRVERENCCDDQAIAWCGNPLTYARALTHLQAISVNAPQLALAFAGKDGSLLGRVKRLVQKPNLRPTFSEGFMAACVLIVGLTVISVSAFAGFSAESNLTKPVKTAAIKPTPVKAAPVVKPPTEDILKASIYHLTDSLTGKKSDLIIIKNKKGDITELYVDGKKIPKASIADFRKEIEAATANTQRAPRLKASEVPQQLAKTKEALKEVESENKTYAFSYSGNADGFGKMPPIPPMPAVPGVPAIPAMPPLPPVPPKKPLEYLRTLDLPTNTLYIIDGTKYLGKSGKAALAKLKDDKINSVQIYHAEAAKSRFGDEGKDGVVVIKTGVSDPNNFLLQEIGDDQTSQEEIFKNLRENQEQLAKEHELRLKNFELQNKARLKEHEIRLKEHEARAKEHEMRAKEHAKRAKEHEKRAAQFEKIKQELIKDKLIEADAKKMSIQINQDGLTINGVKQPAAVFDKYKKLFFPERQDWSGSFNDSININITDEN